MAGDGSTTVFDPTKLPHEFRTRTYGPFSHAAGSGAVAIGVNTNVPIGEYFDRQQVIDSVSFMIDGTVAAAARTFRLAYATEGQTLAQAVSANQYITSAGDFGQVGYVAGTTYAVTVDTTMNLVPAGSRLFLVLGASAETSLAGARIFIRYRSLLR